MPDKITYEEAVAAIKPWLVERGIDPADVPWTAVPEIDTEGSVTLPVYLRNDEGKKYLVGPSEVAQGTTVIRNTAPAPALVLDWLEGRLRLADLIGERGDG